MLYFKLVECLLPRTVFEENYGSFGFLENVIRQCGIAVGGEGRVLEGQF